MFNIVINLFLQFDGSIDSESALTLVFVHIIENLFSFVRIFYRQFLKVFVQIHYFFVNDLKLLMNRFNPLNDRFARHMSSVARRPRIVGTVPESTFLSSRREGRFLDI